MLGEPDVVFDLLIGCDPTHKQEIHEVIVQDLVERGPLHGPGDSRQVDGEGKHAGRFEPHRVQFPPVVIRHAERQVDAANERRQFLPRDRRQTKQRRIVRGKIRRRRHVVVLQQACP